MILPMHSSPRELTVGFPPFDPIEHGSILKNAGTKILSRENSWRWLSSIHQTRFPAEANSFRKKSQLWAQNTYDISPKR
jgi:hypothetical protein